MKRTVAIGLAFALAAVAPGVALGAGKLKISILVDDTVSSDRFLTEHGLAALIELPNGHRWLMDAGTTDVFLLNAQRMGLSLDGLTGIAITHGHDDHTGGLAFYPRMKGAPPIYGNPYIWAKQYEITKGEPLRVAGMPYLARRYASPAFKPVNGVVKLDEDLWFFTDVPREQGSYAPIGGKFYNEDGTGPATIMEDASLVVRTPRGLVVIFGCGHSGYVNILKAVRKEFPNEKLLSVVGGLHLKGAGEKVWSEAATYTAAFRAPELTFYGGHCTGNDTLGFLKGKFAEGVVKDLGSGREIEY
jgi:7,8-dihydropterin-6-yl-methyl-4-(beta-D-ribofuranosyl)aminobenzene 5'-phosphate synthase